MDMEDIFKDALFPYMGKGLDYKIIKKLIAEVESFVDDQKNIECVNCKGKKFKTTKEPWQAM